MRLDGLSAQTPDVSAPGPVVEAVLEEAKLLVPVVPDCDIDKLATFTSAPIVACPAEGELLVSVVPEVRSSSSTDAIIAETIIAEVAEDSPRMAKRKDFMRTMRLRQGISDERYAELLLQEKAAAAAPPPAPQPQRTEEEVMRYMADHLRRHHGPVATTKAFVMPSLFD